MATVNSYRPGSPGCVPPTHVNTSSGQGRAPRMLLATLADIRVVPLNCVSIQRGVPMRIWKLCSAALAMAIIGTGAAYADGCPDGMITNPVGAGGQPQCVPGANHQNWGGGQNSGPNYARRWGAFASDAETAKVGFSTGMTSKRKAEKAALEHCRSKGGMKCEPMFSYYDQCGAVAWGPNSTGKGAITWGRAGRVEEAQTLALQECSKESNQCKVFFAECSYGELVN